MIRARTLVVLVALGSVAGAADLPLAPFGDRLPTVPCAANPHVTQENIRRTICVHNWSQTQRPPTSYTNKIKRDLFRRGHAPGTHMADYELDHCICIACGGDPRNPANLWLQPYFGDCNAHDKDELERRVLAAICATTNPLPLVEGQRLLSQNWIEAYTRLVNPKGCR